MEKKQLLHVIHVDFTMVSERKKGIYLDKVTGKDLMLK